MASLITQNKPKRSLETLALTVGIAVSVGMLLKCLSLIVKKNKQTSIEANLAIAENRAR